MSGLKYTPERAKQAAEQYAHPNSVKGSSGLDQGCLIDIVILLVIAAIVIWFLSLFPNSKSNKEVTEADKAAILQHVCDEIYTVSYDDLESVAFDGRVTVSVNQRNFEFNKKIEIYQQAPFDDINEDIEFKTVIVTIGKIVNEYAAVPNEDGAFTLEPMADFRKRMHK